MEDGTIILRLFTVAMPRVRCQVLVDKLMLLNNPHQFEGDCEKNTNTNYSNCTTSYNTHAENAREP